MLYDEQKWLQITSLSTWIHAKPINNRPSDNEWWQMQQFNGRRQSGYTGLASNGPWGGHYWSLGEAMPSNATPLTPALCLPMTTQWSSKTKASLNRCIKFKDSSQQSNTQNEAASIAHCLCEALCFSLGTNNHPPEAIAQNLMNTHALVLFSANIWASLKERSDD